MTQRHCPDPTLRATAMSLLAAVALMGCASGAPPQSRGATPSPLEQLRSELASRFSRTPAVPEAAASAPAAEPGAAASPSTAGAAASTSAPPSTSSSTSATTPTPAPASSSTPRAEAQPSEPRFDLVVNGALSRDVFLALVADTPYSMLMHPEVNGTLSVTLRKVTVREALDSIRDVYGFDYRIDGRRITVYPPTMQTRIFTLNYLNANRQGRSDLRVSSGTSRVSGSPLGNGTQGNGAPGSTASPSSGSGVPDSSQVSTQSSADVWAETAEALRSIVGQGNGRSVTTSPQSGTIAVRAMPDELRQVDAFLRASRAALDRQVMLEAKIVEVELREGFQSGIDWSVLRGRGSIGQTSGYANNALVTNPNGQPTLPAAIGQLLVDSVALPSAGAGTLGLSLATRGFSAVLGFLETHGEVQILSNPRVATLNNQKAVLKVGTDEYFVTNVTGGTITTGAGTSGGTTTLPSLTLTPFFSGIALDVTPQIDEGDVITLHVRPSVTRVTEKTKQIDLGAIGNYRLPLASNTVNETDTMVRVNDGNIVAIGGLMQSEADGSQSGLPGANSNAVTRTLFGNTGSGRRKKELVILIKPTIIRGTDDWRRQTDQMLASLDPGMASAAGAAAAKTITVHARPGADAKLGVDAKTGVDAKPVADAKPGVDAKVVAEAKPATDAKPAVDQKPAAGVKPAADAKLLAQAQQAALPLADAASSGATPTSTTPSVKPKGKSKSKRSS